MHLMATCLCCRQVKRTCPNGKAKLAVAGYARLLPRLLGFTCFSVDALHQYWLARHSFLNQPHLRSGPCSH